MQKRDITDAMVRLALRRGELETVEQLPRVGHPVPAKTVGVQRIASEEVEMLDSLLLWDPSNRSIIFLVRNTSHRYKEESGITHAYHIALAVDPLSRTIKTAMHGRRAIRPRWVPIDSSPFWWWQR
jgi:hypothetical protein